ncbi:transposase [Lactiplantibacillus plantarum]|uniref:RNA-guided endonuclease InsQ/TnpB family protein n=1 Tax=Lactiplantibacillus plantarum TaxID=1590 RepID=UPI001BA9F20F|nr:RNA-guided endonuclease TnpB family protein [Lactiplantibacillus plantarum]MBS0953600.1 transposase [Lactiplantibacillus plantarum]
MTDLKYHYGLKMRIFPSSKQKRSIDNNINASRFAYNEMVAIDKELFLLQKVKIPIKIVQDRIFYLRQRKNNTQMLFAIHPWLAGTGVGTDVIDQARRAYQSAWRLFRQVHRSGVPIFHRKRDSGSYQLPTRYTKTKIGLMNGSNRFIDWNHMTISGLGKIRVAGSQQRLINLANTIRVGTITVRRDSTGRYFLSMQLGSDTPFVQTSKSNHEAIGIDLNTDNFLTDSNGNVVSNPRYYRSIKGKLAKAQRKLSRRALRAKKEHRPLRNAKNYQKQRALVAALQRKVANRRKSFLHLVSTTLIKNHDFVVAEELRSKNMLRNHALAMSIADVGWRTLLGMLSYKADLYDRQFVTINPRNTTQTCHDCGFVMGTAGTKKLTLNDRDWTCPQCGIHHIRDWNAANNILDKGLEKLATN